MSRARDLANGVTTLAPLASPDFTGTVDLTGTTLSLDNDQISGDKVSGGTIGAGTFNGTIGSSANMPSGTVIKMGQTKFAGDAYQTNSASYTGYVSAGSFTPDGGPNNTSTIYPIVTSYIESAHTDGANNLFQVAYKITGNDITDTILNGTTLGTVDYGNSPGSQVRYWFNTYLPGVTLDGTGNASITVSVAVANSVTHSSKSVTFYGNNTFDESYVTFIEVV